MMTSNISPDNPIGTEPDPELVNYSFESDKPTSNKSTPKTQDPDMIVSFRSDMIFVRY